MCNSAFLLLSRNITLYARVRNHCAFIFTERVTFYNWSLIPRILWKNFDKIETGWSSGFSFNSANKRNSQCCIKTIHFKKYTSIRKRIHVLYVKYFSANSTTICWKLQNDREFDRPTCNEFRRGLRQTKIYLFFRKLLAAATVRVGGST